METLRLKGTVDKKEALLAGRASFGSLFVEVTNEILALLSKEERQFLAEQHGTIDLKLPPEEPSAKIVAEAICQAKQNQQAEIDAAVAELLAKPLLEIPDMYSRTVRLAEKSEVGRELIARANEAKLAARKTKDAELLKTTEENQRRNAEKAATAAKIAAENKSIEEAFIASRGNLNQRERYEAGCLPIEDLLNLRKADREDPVFPEMPMYTRICGEDIQCTEECYHREINFTSEVYTDAVSAKVWDDFQAIKTAVLKCSPEAKVEIRKHKGWCNSCDTCEYRLSVRASVKWAGHDLVRFFRLDGTELELRETE